MASVSDILPEDGFAGTLVGRVETAAGPSVVALRAGGVFDISTAAPTVADLCNAADPVARQSCCRNRLGDHAPTPPSHRDRSIEQS